ncbi:MAG: ATP-binding cassette domain-containing protein [Bacteroidetes bacterium]|nr:ATP-binding cassette domain-containing protein [Bacteroidota bacterium]
MALVVHGLTKQYGSQTAVNNVSFEIDKGEVVGFLGPNGAGKSTTMKMITCFIHPSAGNATLDGYDITQHPLEVRRRIGYLPEHNPLYLDMYVHEFLRFCGRLYGLGRQELNQRIPRVVEMTGLGPEQHKRLSMLSRGYRQRAGLAQALLHDPQMLILDEPTSGLDPNQVVEIRSLIKEVGKEKTVLFSSHILSEVETVAQRVLLIHKGQLRANTPIAELAALTSGEQAVRVEVEKPGFRLEGIRQMEGVQHVQQVTDTVFRILTVPGLDVRKQVYNESVDQENSILSLSREESSLEDLFQKLTRDN